jgi:mxaD protein
MEANELDVEASRTFRCPAESVWRLLGAWGGLAAYGGGVTSCEADGSQVGAIRHVTLADGTRFSERLVDLDSAAMTYAYTFVDAPEGFPIVDYVARITVTGIAVDRCRATWRGRFRARASATDAEAQAFVQGAYDANLEGLRRIFERER